MASGVVLIADPDAAAREEYEVALSRAGFSVVSAGDGTSALRLASRLTPDRLLTEILLPQLDGFHLARRLRHEPKTENIRIVAVTSYAGDDLKQRAAESGIDAVLRKPRSIYDVVRAIRATARGSEALTRQSATLRDEVDAEIFRGRSFRERAEDVIAESRVVAADIERALSCGDHGGPQLDDEMFGAADGARDVLVVDRVRGEQLFEVLFERYGDHPLLHYKRGEAYRASGRRKLAHREFALAAERLPEGAWRDRARFAVMRTRSHHEKPGK